MILRSTYTTRQLERAAQRRGLSFGILDCADNTAGRYFVTTQDDTALARWVALGWTRAEAEERLAELEAARASRRSEARA